MTCSQTWMESHDEVFGDFYAATSPRMETFREELTELMRIYEERTGWRQREVLLRFHLSDVSRYESELREWLGDHRHSFISVVGQPPANGARIGLEAWHIDGISRQLEESEKVRCLRGRIHAGEIIFSSLPSLSQSGSHKQMREEWEGLDALLSSIGANVERDLQRTWIYCRDVDNNYQGLVDARNDWFAANGMTSETHFIASTGIDGQFREIGRFVGMDSFSMTGLERSQIEYLNAPEYLSSTHIYGVAFERGVRLVFGDGSLYFISGTASIDRNGDIVHPGDVLSQLSRTLENITALMEGAGGCLEDLKLACVYLRDMADAPVIERELSASPLANVPRLLLKAPVCRPGWLLEIDAIASNRAGSAHFSCWKG